jgi:hypothetical protein
VADNLDAWALGTRKKGRRPGDSHGDRLSPLLRRQCPPVSRRQARRTTTESLPQSAGLRAAHRHLTTQISSGIVFIMNTIPPQGIGANCIFFEGKAPIPYGKSYS